jgi:hypothetical protein
VITDFGSYLRPGDTEIGKGEVEGGIFGMAVYYAREFIRNQSARKALADAEAKLNLRVSTTLGTLVFNDFKVNTNCVVEAIDGATITVAGKRGKYIVKLETNALGIPRFSSPSLTSRRLRKTGMPRLRRHVCSLTNLRQRR